MYRKLYFKWRCKSIFRIKRSGREIAYSMMKGGFRLFYLLLLFLGAALGSFYHVVGYRMPIGENWVSDRSRCDAFGHEDLRHECQGLKIGLRPTVVVALEVGKWWGKVGTVAELYSHR